MRTIAKRPGLAAGVAEQTRAPGYLPGIADRADLAVAEPPTMTAAQVDAFALVEPVESPGDRLDREMASAPDLPDERDQRIAELEARLAAAEQLAARIARTAPAPFDPHAYVNPNERGKAEVDGRVYSFQQYTRKDGTALVGWFEIVAGADGQPKASKYAEQDCSVVPANAIDADKLERKAERLALAATLTREAASLARNAR